MICSVCGQVTEHGGAQTILSACIYLKEETPPALLHSKQNFTTIRERHHRLGSLNKKSPGFLFSLSQ
jgi:hypothetical protein